MCKKNILFFLVLQTIIFPLNASIGSNTAVSRQAAYALFPYSSIPTNQLLGFTAAQQGIVLGRSDVTALFTDYFPVSTLMDLRSGGLLLNVDLTLDQTVSFASTGSFVASGGSAIYLPVLNTSLGFPSAKNLLSFITAQTQATAPLSADWSFDSGFVANTNGVNVQVNSFNGSALTAATSVNPAGSAVQVVRWHPTLYYIAEAHTLAAGNDVRTYLFTPPATLTLASGIAAATAPAGLSFSPDGQHLGYTSAGGINILSFNTGTGAIALAATLAVTTFQADALDWIDNTFLATGLSTSPQLRIYSYNGAATVAQVATNAVGNTVTAVAPARFGGYIGVGLTGSTTNIRIYQFNGVATVSQVASLNESLAVNSMDWSPTGSFLSVGLATSSTASQIRVYYFDPTNLTLTLTGQVSSPSPTMNDIRWSPNSNYVMTADSNASGTATFLRAVTIYQLLNETMPFVFVNTKMVMNSGLTMGAPITFQGLCAIEGNENTLDLGAINNFSISSTSTLLLKNMIIKGISDGKINFVDNTGVLQLQDVTWVQTNTYTFTQGALQIQNSVMMTGTAPFIYQSARPLTINSNSTMMFDSGMTFSYAPSSSANNLISMTDQTSILYFMNTALVTSAIGMQLTKGTFVIDGPCQITNSGTNLATGITFGDGASAANNCTVKVLPESGFLINSGFLVHNNV